MWAASCTIETRESYKSHWQHYREFCEQENVNPLDLTDENVAIWATYAAFYAPRPLKAKTVGNYLVGIRHIGRALTGRSELAWPLTDRVIAGIKKAKGTRPKEKLAVTMSMVAAIYHRKAVKTWDDWLALAITSTGIHGLHRKGELLAKRATQIDGFPLIGRFEEAGQVATLLLLFSKTDQMGQGAKVVYPNSGHHLMPGPLVRKYLQHRSGCAAHEPLFLRNNRQLATRSWYDQWLRTELRAIGVEASRYHGMSWRRGGTATIVAQGEPGYVLGEMGRWSTDCYRRYFSMRTQHKLSVLRKFTAQL